jgi:DNA polymerase delta subunit 1
LLFLQKLSALREAEIRYSNLWSEAQRIHGTVLSDIICTGDGCACNFYRRKKAIGDVRLARENIDKFL